MVIEVFGYSVRAGDPDLAVYTLTGSDHELDFFHPIDSDDWTDADDVTPGTSQVVVRGDPVELPVVEEYAAHGIDLQDPPQPAVIDVCRYLAAVHRDRVLATTEERRTRLRPDLRELWCSTNGVTRTLLRASVRATWSRSGSLPWSSRRAM